MFHTVRRSALLTGASPAKGAEEDLGLALRKPKRRFAKSPLDRGAAGTRDGESAMDVEITVTPGLHSSREDESVSKKVRDRERDEFSFVDSQDFNEGAPSEGGAGGMAVDAVAPLLLVSADKDRVDDIIDTDDESVLRSRDTSSSKGTAKANAKEELPAHSPSSVSLIHVERNGPKKRLSKGKKQSPKKSPKGKAPVNEASPLPLPAKETAQVEDVPAQSPHDDDVPNSICLKTSKWRDVWKILKDVGWYWKKGSGMVDCYYIRPGHSTASLKSFNGVHVFCSTNDVWSFLTSVCEKRARAAQMLPVSPSISPSGIKEDVSEDKDEVAASETNVGHGCPSQQTQEHQMQDQDPYETKTAEGGIDDWVPHVMTIPWKILYLVHLTNEGWSWNYGHGLNDECYYAPGFGPVEESKKKEMTEAQVLEQESRVPIANVSKFSSKEDVRRYIRRTRWPDYEPSELSQREEAEAVASFGEDWNLARNRKRRKSNPCFPYNPEEYVNNTCDMSQTVQDLKEQLPTKSKKSKNSVDDASGSDRDRRTLPDEGGRNSCPEPSPSGRSKSSRQSNSPANRAIAGKITNNSTHNRQISCFDQPVVNSSTSTNRNHADAGDYEDEDDQPVMAAVMERREKERLLRMKVGRAEDAEGSGSGSMPSAGPHTHTKHHRHDNRSAVHHREVSGDIQSVDSSVSVSVSALGPRDTGTGTGTVERQMVPKGVLKNGLLEPYGERQRQRQRQQGGGIDSGRAGYKGSGMRQVMMGVEDRDRDRDDRSPHDLYGHEHDGGGDADTQQQDVSPITSLHWKDTNWQYGDNPPSRNSQRSTGKRSQSASSSSSVVSTPYNTFTANISAEMQTVKTGSLPKSRIVASSGPGSSMLMTAATAERGRPRGKGQGPGSGTSRLSLGLFSGLTFILSGITEEEREAVAARIQRCGGTVISQLPFLKEMEDHLTLVRRASANNSSPPYCDPTVKVGTLSQGIILLSRPTNFRKTNYLLVLATGGTLLHHLWAARCMDANALLPREEYLLPSGASALWPSYIFPKVRPPPAFGVLACLSVLNFAGEKWASLLAVCGMNVSPHNEALLKAFAPGKVIDRRMYGVDIVVVDCLSYCESVTRRRMNKTPSKRDKEAGVLSSLELAAIEGCVSREGQLSVHEGGIKVVTIDWVVHCLQLGEQVAFNSNDVFALPLDPINRPLGHKNDSKKGNGERFMKYDVCYYRRSNEDKDLLGQIRGFSRKNPSSPMQVRIRPLVLSGGYQGECRLPFLHRLLLGAAKSKSLVQSNLTHPISSHITLPTLHVAHN